jgi:hypothetical protein
MIANQIAAVQGVSAPPAPTYTSTVLGDNPIGFWLLDETSGTTGDDLTTNNNNLTFYNSPTLNVSTGLTGITKAITFDGSNDYLQTAEVSTFNVAPSGNYSVEMWIKYSTSSFLIPFSWRDSSGGAANLVCNIAVNNSATGSIDAYFGNSGGGLTVIGHTNSYNNNAWHQVVVTATSAGAFRLYIDGVDRANTTAARGTGTGNKSILVAANNNAGSPNIFYAGTGTAVSVYNTVLTGTEITDHYNTGI